MPQATFHFPRGFLWGTATAAHQVEGNNRNNNWAAWEAEPGRITNKHKAGLACDWWGGRWKDDFDRAAEAGQNAHRMSIEWSRVQPMPDQWDEDALDYYREMVRGLVERNLTPVITLHHFSDPTWLFQQGGWLHNGTPKKFARFVYKVVDALKEYVNLWVTINEPNVYTYSAYIEGVFPPGIKDLNAAFRVMRNMLRGHAGAYHIIHEVQKEARVGIAHNFRGFWPARPKFPPDVWMARTLGRNFNEAFPFALQSGKLKFGFKSARVQEAEGTQDFIGVNYYTVDLVRFDPLAFRSLFHKRQFPLDAEISDTGFLANVPQGLWEVLKWAKRFKKPIMILENGVEGVDDSLRNRYMIEHIHQVWRAVNENYPIKGYFYWTLVDNFEWERGWTQRFGLWNLNTETQARIRRTSADLYEAICRENGVSSAMVEKFAPQIFDKMFPI